MICIPQVLQILYMVIVANISQIVLLCFDSFPLFLCKMRDFVKLNFQKNNALSISQRNIWDYFSMKLEGINL